MKPKDKFNTLPDYNLSRPLAKPKYRIIYHVNNDKINLIDNFPVDTQTYNPGDKVQLVGATDSFYSVDGNYVYKQSGWALRPRDVLIELYINETIIVPHHDLHLYALWHKDETFTVDYKERAITGFKQAHKNIPYFVVPEYAGGVRIHTIGAGAFSGTAIREVVVPASITLIKTNAFVNWGGQILRFVDARVTEKYPALTIEGGFLSVVGNLTSLVLPYRWHYFTGTPLLGFTEDVSDFTLYVRNRASFIELNNPDMMRGVKDGEPITHLSIDSAIKGGSDADVFQIVWEYNE